MRERLNPAGCLLRAISAPQSLLFFRLALFVRSPMFEAGDLSVRRRHSRTTSPGAPREAVLAAWGFTVGGKKALLGLAPGTKEDTASRRDFLRDLKNRNLCEPVLISTDGAPGLMRAMGSVSRVRFVNDAWRTRCAISKRRCRPRKWPEVKSAAWSAYTAASPSAPSFYATNGCAPTSDLPAATACFLDDFSACIAHLKLTSQGDAHHEPSRATVR
jgi:hypothetical protein